MLGTARVLADPARLCLIHLLAENGSMTQLELVEQLGWLKQPTVAHHLKTLAAAGLVIRSREGQAVRSRLDSAALMRIGRPRSEHERGVNARSDLRGER